MKSNQKGFSVIEIILVLFVVTLVGAVIWMAVDRQKIELDTANSNNNQTIQQDEDNQQGGITPQSDIKTVDNIKYIVPSNWVAARGPFNDSGVEGSGQYLLSPDYKEAGLGQLSIAQGAYINFHELEWAGIDSNTSVEEAANVVKKTEGAYLDTNSVKVSVVGGVNVVTYNGGHTTDGVRILHKTSSSRWLLASFNTTSSNDAIYNAQNSSHYETFEAWLLKFIELNP